MPGQGRLGDKAKAQLDTHGCLACPHVCLGPAIRGSDDVNVNGRPALRVDDPGIHSPCCGANTWTATKGSSTVFINGKAAYRVGDQSRHCGGMGQLIDGSSNVVVGDAGGGGGQGGSTGRGSATPGAGAGAAAGGGAAAVTSPVAVDFLELRLVDSEGLAVSFASFRVTAADGSVHEGMLDADGQAQLEGLPPGSCSVSFPELHGDDWGPG
jgi:uncharacterized Zn-binding protein involved in type VI secretion